MGVKLTGTSTLGFAGLLLALSLPAGGWTVPAPVVATGEDSLDPRLSVDGNGKAHVVWRERINGGLFHIWYTNNAGGSFAAPTTISHGGSMGAFSAVPCADGAEVHAAWVSATGDNYEIWYRKRTAGTWGSIFNASNTTIKSLRPAVGARGTVGPVVAWDEALYADDNYDTFFSEWTGGGFSPAINISNTPGGQIYGSVNVNLVVGPGGDLTVVWVDSITGSYRVNARRRVGGTWQARQELSTLATGPATPGLAVSAWGQVYVTYESGGTIWYQVHNGSNWSAPAGLPGGLNSVIRPRIAVDEDGVLHVVADAFVSGNNRDVMYTNNLGGSFAGWSNLFNSPNTQSYNAEIGYANNVLTVTWQENSNGQGGTGTYNTWFVTGPKPSSNPTGTLTGTVYDDTGATLAGAMVSIGGAYQAASGPGGAYTIGGVYVGTYEVTASKQDYTPHTVNGVVITAGTTTVQNFTLAGSPPQPVTAFTVTGGNTANALNWTNPSSPNFVGTVVRAKTGGYPAAPTDGTLVADRPAAPGSSDGLVHSGLTNGTTWYYAAFAYAGSTGRYYAAPVVAWGTPAGPGDMDRDGDVDQEDFGLFQACYSGAFNPQPDPSCAGALLDGDDDVDPDDVLRFIGCMSGPGVPASPSCNP